MQRRLLIAAFAFAGGIIAITMPTGAARRGPGPSFGDAPATQTGLVLIRHRHHSDKRPRSGRRYFPRHPLFDHRPKLYVPWVSLHDHRYRPHGSYSSYVYRAPYLRDNPYDHHHPHH